MPAVQFLTCICELLLSLSIHLELILERCGDRVREKMIDAQKEKIGANRCMDSPCRPPQGGEVAFFVLVFLAPSLDYGELKADAKGEN